MIAGATVTGTAITVTALLGVILSAAAQLENEAKGVQLGVLALIAPPEAPTLPAPFGATSVIEPASALPAPAPARSAPAPSVTSRITRGSPAAEVDRRGIIGSLPVIGRITSNFSRARRHPLLGVVRRHKGIDIAAPSGTRITAPASGRVRFAGRQVGFGLVVELDHGRGVVTRYAHCRSLSVAVGARVRAGQTIAAVGRTGLATGPHLHYEVLVGGRSVDPLRTSLSQLLPSESSAGEGIELPPAGLHAPSPAVEPGRPTTDRPDSSESMSDG